MGKGPQAFRTISEAADELGVPQHVLRFWETRFSFIRPMKRAGGRRFYRPQDLAVLAGVRALLHRDGLSIKAVQTLYKEEGVKSLLAAAEALPSPPSADEPPPPRREPAALPEPSRYAMDLDPPWDDPLPEPDLFAKPPQPDASPVPPPSESPPEPQRPRLNPVARAKLAAKLTELEEIKARLDSLLDKP